MVLNRLCWRRMSRSEVISILALLVSALSLGVAFLSYWRSYLAEQPNAWLEGLTTQIPNEWLANIHLINRSSFGWRARHAVVPVTVWPVTDKQDFLMRAGPNASPNPVESEASAFNYKVALSGGVLPGESAAWAVVLRRGPLSDASAVTITFIIESMVAKPRSKILIIKADLPNPSATMVLG
jgi:hypothetical protein